MADAETPVSKLKNIGPETARWLNDIGIETRADLERVGAVDAWRQLKIARPRQLTVVGLYALVGALRDEHWNALPAELKARLREAART